MSHSRSARSARLLRSALAALGVFVASLIALPWMRADAASADAGDAVLPVYDGEGQLLLPAHFREWTFVGSSLGLSYSEGSGGQEMFHHTLIEPTAYRHFARTGEFRDGTMLALLLHNPGEQVLPQRRGQVAGKVESVEMAVKDARFAGGWAYFGFGTPDGLRDRAAAFAADSCYSCHAEHAAHDNVFLQFYPLLAEAAPADTVFRTTNARTAADQRETPPPPAAGDVRLALRGLDPVLLTEGREESGKPEIVETWAGLVYRFVSEPSRARFAADPDRYGVQNYNCPVIPDAPATPSLFAVHAGKIYIFASDPCIEEFKADPEVYLPLRPSNLRQGASS